MARIKARLTTTISLSEAFPEFINSCKVKNLSSASIKNYGEKFKKLTSIVSGSTPCSEINRKTVDNMILVLQGQDLSDASINSIIRGTRAFFYWAMEHEYMQKFKITLIKEDIDCKVGYSDADLKVLLRKPKTATFAEYRTWAMVNYLVGTGNRLSTLIALSKGDVDFANNTVYLRHTKNRKPMVIPIGSTLNKVLFDYIKLYLSDYPDDFPLFPNQYGKRFATGGVGIQHSIMVYNRSRGVQLTSIHAFRHAFAKSYILNGGDVFTLQKLLGHNSLEMVRRYVNLYGVDLRKGYDEFNPLERLVENSREVKIKGNHIPRKGPSSI